MFCGKKLVKNNSNENANLKLVSFIILFAILILEMF